jgi:hypothetical protein
MITTGTVRALSDAALSIRYTVAYKALGEIYRAGSEPDAELAADFDAISGEQIRRLIQRQERAREYRAARGKSARA